jgi:hypothetical protein
MEWSIALVEIFGVGDVSEMWVRCVGISEIGGIVDNNYCLFRVFIRWDYWYIRGLIGFVFILMGWVGWNVVMGYVDFREVLRRITDVEGVVFSGFWVEFVWGEMCMFIQSNCIFIRVYEYMY